MRILKASLFILLATLVIYLGSRVYLASIRKPHEVPLEVEKFMSQLKDKIVQEDWLKIGDYSKVTLGQHEGEYGGFDWLNEESEIELIKGFWISYDPQDFSIGDTPPNEDVINGVKRIHSYILEKGFTLNERNTYYFVDATEEQFWNSECAGQIAYEKGSIRCYLFTPIDFTEGGFSVGCGDALKSHTPYAYRAIYNLANPERWPGYGVHINRIVENFARGGVGSCCAPGGAAVIWKEENGKWKEVFATQMAWSCSVLLDNKVPPSLLTGTFEDCVFYECYECEGDACGDLKDECERQAAGEEFIYKELYEEQFGKER